MTPRIVDPTKFLLLASGVDLRRTDRRDVGRLIAPALNNEPQYQPSCAG